ncbi:anthranilate synthase component I [Anaeromicropila populeti]|uniref:Anthranilate synthase component 1 n=1 Tax=Anaeromicropila populeti TaxID=37658 RepID=A0A1I6JYB3_9FIRM|nr:anthranilate synthase component I [Anaeromicropila populeti]SFR83952.1 anthranilate synthase, component I [Anaeromicropila populeti]
MRKLRAYRKTVSIVNETTIGLYEGFVGNKLGFLLESYDKNNGRYSIFGKEPAEIIHSEGNQLVIEKRDGTKEVKEGNPFLLLKEYYSNFQVTKDDGELAFIGGLVGNMGYDFVRYTEDIPDDNSDEIGIETIYLMYTKEFFVIDHVAETLTAVVLEEDSEAGRELGMSMAKELVEAVTEGYEEVKQKAQTALRLDGKIIKKSDTLEEYSQKVEKIKEYIIEGHIFQTVLSQRWTIETEQEGFILYKALRELNPSPYLYYFNFGGFEVIGSSPEMLVKQLENKVYTCPIAGTRKRGANPEEDELLKDDLLSDAKERAEHVMLVDLARNDMGRISEFGTVKVTQFMNVQNYSHVMHIVSLVEGRKKGESHPLDLVASFLPAGTLSGAPKIRAMEIIDELENTRRGLYGGATGYLSFDGNMDFCITIRTMIKKGKNVYLQAGAGIVLDSVPQNEYNECCNKVMALAKTLVTEDNL